MLRLRSAKAAKIDLYPLSGSYITDYEDPSSLRLSLSGVEGSLRFEGRVFPLLRSLVLMMTFIPALGQARQVDPAISDNGFLLCTGPSLQLLLECLGLVVRAVREVLAIDQFDRSSRVGVSILACSLLVLFHPSGGVTGDADVVALVCTTEYVNVQSHSVKIDRDWSLSAPLVAAYKDLLSLRPSLSGVEGRVERLLQGPLRLRSGQAETIALYPLSGSYITYYEDPPSLRPSLSGVEGRVEGSLLGHPSTPLRAGRDDCSIPAKRILQQRIRESFISPTFPERSRRVPEQYRRSTPQNAQRLRSRRAG